MRPWRLLIPVLIVLAGVGVARGANGANGAAHCTLKDGGHGVVARVVSGDTAELEDQRRLKLIGALAPVPALDDPPEIRGRAEQSRAALDDLIGGKPVRLRFGGRRVDRYGRLLAHVFLNDKHKTWVQARMISSGFARAYSFKDNAACIAALLEHEDKARLGKRGHWPSRYYRIGRADRPSALIKGVNRFYLVEGRVIDVSFARKRVYMNFGTDWKSDFTVVISRSNARRIEAKGPNLADLKGRRVRVRGWIALQNGPMIEVTHPGQLEILKNAPK